MSPRRICRSLFNYGKWASTTTTQRLYDTGRDCPMRYAAHEKIHEEMSAALILNNDHRSPLLSAAVSVGSLNSRRCFALIASTKK